MLTIAIVLFLIVTFLMIVAILLQSSKSDALGAGFGALGGSQVFGGRGAGDFLKKFTAWLAVLFFVGTISLSFLYRTSNSGATGNALLKDAQETAVQQSVEETNTGIDLPTTTTDSTKN